MNSEIPLTPSGASGDARQHQMHDVLCHVVLAERDEDLLCRRSGSCRCPAAPRFARTSDRSLPAWGSVRFIVPVQLAGDQSAAS